MLPFRIRSVSSLFSAHPNPDPAVPRLSHGRVAMMPVSRVAASRAPSRCSTKSPCALMGILTSASRRITYHFPPAPPCHWSPVTHSCPFRLTALPPDPEALLDLKSFESRHARLLCLEHILFFVLSLFASPAFPFPTLPLMSFYPRVDHHHRRHVVEVGHRI